jgi:hypothetical protein
LLKVENKSDRIDARKPADLQGGGHLSSVCCGEYGVQALKAFFDQLSANSGDLARVMRPSRRRTVFGPFPALASKPTLQFNHQIRSSTPEKLRYPRLASSS